MSTLTPLRRAATHRDIDDRCACTWTWRTRAKPWHWDLTREHPSCPVHRPVDADAAAITRGN